MVSCKSCPIDPNSVTPCCAITHGHRRLCELIASGRDDYRDVVIRLTNGGPPPEAKPPGLVAMSGNLARAVVAHVADGAHHASPEVQADRKRICLSNECGHCINGGKGCTACGCGTIAALSFVGLDMVLKRSLASSRCPLNPPRWEAVP